VLVVDDNEDSAGSLALLLRLTGHEARTAADGLEAVERAEGFRPELILMDLGLPRLNGYEACRRIREKPWGAEVVIVACTGYGMEADRKKTQEAGFDQHLLKPVDPKELATVIRSACPPGG
jgi:CheY-like chemotaxis protein